MAIFKTHGIEVEYNDFSPVVLLALKNAVSRGLGACGERAVEYAIDKCPVDTSWLSQNISYKLMDEECYIGTNIEYAPYVEYGTGIYAENGDGRKTPWIWTDKNGDTHFTRGQKPQPFLRPAAQDHAKEYLGILKDSLINA